MRIKGSRKSFWFVIVTTCLVVALVISGAMVFNTPSVQNMFKNDATKMDVILSKGDAGGQADAYHTVDTQRLQPVCTDGLVQMLFDPVSMAPVIYETTEKHSWYAMPLSGTGVDLTAAVFTIEVANGGARYLLNSQNNSVAMGNATAHMDAAGKKIKVNYIIAASKADAEKEKARLAALVRDNRADASVMDAMAFSISVTYTLKDGSFFAEVDCSQLQNNDKNQVLSLSLLPGFGSSTQQTSEGDFLFVPDGSGAVVDLSKPVNEFSPVALDVYGSDPAVAANKGKKQSGVQAVIPAFGVKQNKSAFLALVEQGDVWSAIHANRVTGGENATNQVYPAFMLTSNSRTLVKGVGDESDYFMDVLAPQPHKEKLSVCYRFLSQSNATYGGMAITCREQLIRNGTLASTEVSGEDYLPFQLSVLGQADVQTRTAGISYNATKTLTTFEQAYDMVEQMRVKGINAISLRYYGMLEQGGAATAQMSSALGSHKKLQVLADYMKNEKLELYADVNLLSAPNSSWKKGQGALGVNSRPILFEVPNQLVGNDGAGSTDFSLRKMETLEQSVESLLTNLKKLPVTGICVNDAGSLLYSDASEVGVSLREAKEKLQAQTPPLSVNHKLMVDTGNVYMLRGADTVVNMPLESSRTGEDGTYRSVPFLQMVLHGLLDYAGTPINQQADYKTAMLRAVEYGACPNFSWTYEDTSSFSKENRSYYADWLVPATDYYAKANAALYDVRGARITGHYEAAENVFCTVYDNKYSVYVNYNDKEMQVDGIVIPPMDFIRV